jgi:hypothetical protein
MAASPSPFTTVWRANPSPAEGAIDGQFFSKVGAAPSGSFTA